LTLVLDLDLGFCLLTITPHTTQHTSNHWTAGLIDLVLVSILILDVCLLSADHHHTPYLHLHPTPTPT
jgi:hypothetical protein